MGSIDETSIDAEAARPAAAHLRSSARDLLAHWNEHVKKIEQFNETKPWGTDGPGKEFEKAYLEGENSAKIMIDGGKKLVDAIARNAEEIPKAIEGTVATEQEIATTLANIDGVDISDGKGK